jgi:hypothetical protein
LPFPAAAQEQPAAAPTPNAPDATGAETAQKMQAIHISLDFKNATIEEAAYFLRVESKHFDPDHKGFIFIISPDASAMAKPVTLTLNNVSYGLALRTIVEAANVKFKVEGRAIRILSLAENPKESMPPPPPETELGKKTAGKLQSILIDKVNFEKLDIAVVVQFLAEKSKELDPDHEGINFVLGDIGPNDHVRREVSITLENVPLADLLKYIDEQTNLHYTIQDNVVTLKP